MSSARVPTLLALTGAALLGCGGGGGGGSTPAQPPAAPQGVTATGGDGTVTVQWTAVSGATSYKLYWSTSPGASVASGTAMPGVTSPYVHGGRTNGTTCHDVVTALNDAGESAASAEVSATPSMGVGVWDASSWDRALWAP